MSEEEEKGFKVNDKRRFDDSGNLRSEDEPATPEADSAGGDFVMQEGSASAGPTPGEELTFSSFILSLATQALVQLGEMPAPPGMEIPKSPEGAKHMIDIMAMIAEKTKGNLSKEEENLLTEMLHNLRLGYVKQTG